MVSRDARNVQGIGQGERLGIDAGPTHDEHRATGAASGGNGLVEILAFVYYERAPARQRAAN